MHFLKEKEHIPVETHKKLSIQPQPIACGPKHCAVIRNGDVYTCGKSQGGRWVIYPSFYVGHFVAILPLSNLTYFLIRLGVGDIPQNACPPVRVENLHTLQLKVDAVACGCEHTLALTQQGVELLYCVLIDRISIQKIIFSWKKQTCLKKHEVLMTFKAKLKKVFFSAFNLGV